MLKIAPLTFLLVALAQVANSDTVRFDVNGAAGPTQKNWVSVDPKTGVGKNKSYTLTLSPIVRNFNRDRKVANTEYGKDNNDNEVPVGTFASMYRDFMFILPGTLTGTISGLAPHTTYPITVFSWDSAQGSLNEVDWGPKGNSRHRISFYGDLTCNTKNSIDPNTSKTIDYCVSFNVTADASGNAVFEGVSTKNASVIVLNGIVVGNPVPTSKSPSE